MTITRRRLLAAASAVALTILLPSPLPLLARPLLLHGGFPRAGVVTQTLTFVNSSISATPSDVPILATMWFAPADPVTGAPADVPSGSIAVPQIGGVDQAYQADNVRYWGDGSLRVAVFRIARSGSIAGGASVQIGFNIRVGSYSNTTTLTTADITGATDYKVTLSNVHTAKPAFIADKMVALTIGGGQVTGGKVWFPAATTIGATAVQNGNGSGAQISVSAGVLSVDSPGSGYSNVGTGSFEASFNAIVAAVASGGNHANGVSLEYYAQGQYCLGVKARTKVSGLPHAHVTFYVEIWRKADGTFLDFRRCAVVGNGMYDTANAIFNYTYDLDFKDGSTIIVGANGGDTRYQTLMNFVGASCGTFDIEGLPYWASANNAAWNAVAHERTIAECDYLKKTGIILPYRNDITLTIAAPVVHASFGTNTAGTEEINICDYQPFGNAGIRSPLGAGGNGDQEAPMQELDGIYWMSLRQGLTSNARIWRRNIRVSALHCMSMSQLGGGIFEPTTMYPPNVIPAATQAFSGMTPTRETTYLGAVTDNGYAHPLLASSGGTVQSYTQSAYNTYHQVSLAYGAFMLEGEPWLLDAMVHATTSPAIGRFYGSQRQVSLGAGIYYGVYCNKPTNTRDATWAFNAAAKASACSPTAWADGTPNVVQTYVDYLLRSQYSYLLALVPWVGTVKYGSGGAVLTKSTDYTGTGVWPDTFQSGTANSTECSVGFMENYELMALAQNNWLLQGTATGAVLQSWLNYRKNYSIKAWTGATPHYMVETYRLKVLTAGPGSAPLDLSLGFDASNPTVAAQPQPLPGGSQPTVTMSSDGSTTVTLSSSIQIITGSRLANGSRIMVTDTDISKAIGAADTPHPSGFDPAIWYYWKELTATTGQLCTDASLTSPVAAIETQAGFFFWIVPSNSPADNSGFGTNNGGTDRTGNSRLQQRIGPLSMAKAYGMGDDSNGNLTAALATLNTIATSLGGISFGNTVEYAWDTARS